jgi:hypothetical protein
MPLKMGYNAMFIGKLLALVPEVLGAPAFSVFGLVNATLNIEPAGFSGKSVAIDLVARRRIPEFFSSSAFTTLPKYSSVSILLNSELQLYVSENSVYNTDNSQTKLVLVKWACS